MTFPIPQSSNLSTNKLSSVFNNTSATYKYYWFISIIQLFNERINPKILMEDILINMICKAWYPVNYFKLNFGYSDNLSKNITKIQKKLNIPIDISGEDLFVLLKTTTNREVKGFIFHFDKYVPYRFLSPWIKGSKSEIIHKSETYSNNCLYRFNTGKSKSIEINPEWTDYLRKNYKILLDFSYWNLLQYLQTRNPNVPNISNKLIKPATRSSLNRQKNFWNSVIDKTGAISCIYTGNELKTNQFDLDHFIPWSFIAHDQLWNLIPVDSSINPSKSNKLPILKEYFEPFVFIQHKAINTIYKKTPGLKLLEDYLILGESIDDIIQNPFSDFKKRYYNILSPLIQIASNSGFEFWER